MFAAIGSADFENDFAVGRAAEASADEADEEFGGCDGFGEVGPRRHLFLDTRNRIVAFQVEPAMLRAPNKV